MSRSVKAKNKKAGSAVYKKEIVHNATESHVAKSHFFTFLITIVVITAFCFSPMLQNDFTNWDDEQYVINNALLIGPDWKGIFTTPVAGNYHPITILSLALNYQLSQLEPTSYLLFNLLMHLINTGLVFYFIWKISDKKIWVAAFTALVFGVHPMHVESVAWISERKDVLYTAFFLCSLLSYWQYLMEEKQKWLWASFFLFLLSVLSKPAALVLPLILLLLDYWKGRRSNIRMALEKIPFFLAAFVFGIITLKVQEHAMTGLDVFSVGTRMLFACYAIMIYFFRFFIPYPLSAFHPYPPVDDLGWVISLSPLFIIALAIFLWLFRRKKFVVFGIAFFLINLLLVIQLVSIGYTIVSERYTYVPYIGLAFMFGMLLNHALEKRVVVRMALLVVLFCFGYLSYLRTHVWNNSEALWTDVIEVKDAPIPRTNRAYYYFMMAERTPSDDRDSLLEKAVADCGRAVDMDPNWQRAYETRGLALVQLNRYKEAITDGDSLIAQTPARAIGYSIRGTSFMNLGDYEKALMDFNSLLAIDSTDPGFFNKRGSIYYNHYKMYQEALDDFSRAIAIKQDGTYYLNRSRCYYLLGEVEKARADVRMTIEKGIPVSDEYRQLLNL